VGFLRADAPLRIDTTWIDEHLGGAAARLRRPAEGPRRSGRSNRIGGSALEEAIERGARDR
jgi:hypothetical protein